MKIKLIVWLIGLTALAAGFGIRYKIGFGPHSLIALCVLLAFTFVSAGILVACEKGKYEPHSCVLFLIACLSLIGFIL